MYISKTILDWDHYKLELIKEKSPDVIFVCHLLIPSIVNSIVSKGSFGHKVELKGNVTGANYVNQLNILPRVDLVIFHGGYTTFMETLYHGKPMIVLPLYEDGNDSGRRVEDCKIGKCLDPYEVTRIEFVTTMLEVLEDEKMKAKV